MVSDSKTARAKSFHRGFGEYLPNSSCLKKPGVWGMDDCMKAICWTRLHERWLSLLRLCRARILLFAVRSHCPGGQFRTRGEGRRVQKVWGDDVRWKAARGQPPARLTLTILLKTAWSMVNLWLAAQTLKVLSLVGTDRLTWGTKY